LADLEIIFEPDGKRIRVPKGSKILEAAISAGIGIETPCGGMGICGKCKVKLTKGAPPPSSDELFLLSEQEIEDGIRLACRCELHKDAVVLIPEGSRALFHRILVSGRGRDVGLSPNVRKVFVELSKASSSVRRSEVDLFLDELKDKVGMRPKVELGALRRIPRALKEGKGAATAVLVGDDLVDVKPGDRPAGCYGMAFDIGTTTIVGYLLDLERGVELSHGSRMNPQIAYGDDVISRIRYVMEKEDGLETLHDAVIGAVNSIVEEVCKGVGVDPKDVYEMTVVGNTCMTHLFLGVDPSSLGHAPYVPEFHGPAFVPATDLGIRIGEGGKIYVLPNIAGFVGADTVGLILSHLCDEEESPRMAIDIGTNGEVVVRVGDRILACSAAAGPAFEGARISSGMRGAAGAIAHFSVNGGIRYRTIGDIPPIGICGSGLIDIVSELLKLGILDTTGRILSPDELPDLEPSLKDRVGSVDGERCFVVVLPEESGHGRAITLLQRDIREFQLAKGSIRAATNVLMKMAGIEEKDISNLYLAGAFGTYIDKRSAVSVGLLPPIPLERIEGVGNAAGTGAKLALLSIEERKRAEKIASSTQHVELALNPSYQEEFMETMLFPNL
jgi:uncharacterized 2Fe-2S/4Fe-4S cluster protein (DUF4445 family)